MKLDEILSEPDSKIVLEATVGDQVLSFPVSTIKVKNKLLLVEPILMQNKPLSFKGTSLTLNWYRPNEKPVVWKNVGAAYYTIEDNKKVHIIRTTTEPVEINRREDYRQYIGLNGVANAGMGIEELNVTVKNISKSGFAFVSNEQIVPYESRLVKMEFADMDYDQSFLLVGLIVREEITEQNRYAYGCKLNKQDVCLNRYILYKQREELLRIKRNRENEMPDGINNRRI